VDAQRLPIFVRRAPGPLTVADRVQNALLISKVDSIKERPITSSTVSESNELLQEADKSLDKFADFQDNQLGLKLVPDRVFNVHSAEEK